jgi:hypothetical protein
MIIAWDARIFNFITWHPRITENVMRPLAGSLKKRMIVFNSGGEMIRPVGLMVAPPGHFTAKMVQPVAPFREG